MNAAPASPQTLKDIGQIAIRARDIPRAVAYYRDVLGLPLVLEAPGLAFFLCGTISLMLSTPEAPEFDHPSSIIYFRVEDIVEAHRALGAKGVAFRDTPHAIHRAPGKELWMTFFNDTEENTLCLMEWKTVAA